MRAALADGQVHDPRRLRAGARRRSWRCSRPAEADARGRGRTRRSRPASRRRPVSGPVPTPRAAGRVRPRERSSSTRSPRGRSRSRRSQRKLAARGVPPDVAETVIDEARAPRLPRRRGARRAARARVPGARLRPASGGDGDAPAAASTRRPWRRRSTRRSRTPTRRRSRSPRSASRVLRRRGPTVAPSPSSCGGDSRPTAAWRAVRARRRPALTSRGRTARAGSADDPSSAEPLATASARTVDRLARSRHDPARTRHIRAASVRTPGVGGGSGRDQTRRVLRRAPALTAGTAAARVRAPRRPARSRLDLVLERGDACLEARLGHGADGTSAVAAAVAASRSRPIPPRRRREGGGSAPPSGRAGARAARRARAARPSSVSWISSSPENACSRPVRWFSSPGVCGPRSMRTQSTATSSPPRPSASSNSCRYFAARLPAPLASRVQPRRASRWSASWISPSS